MDFSFIPSLTLGFNYHKIYIKVEVRFKSLRLHPDL